MLKKIHEKYQVRMAKAGPRQRRKVGKNLEIVGKMLEQYKILQQQEQRVTEVSDSWEGSELEE